MQIFHKSKNTIEKPSKKKTKTNKIFGALLKSQKTREFIQFIFSTIFYFNCSVSFKLTRDSLKILPSEKFHLIIKF
jgi:hypothetical protein